ncbi:MAG: hypothetical protein IPN57_07340 [Ignavibacteria bacterium]|nr:hypothetical protein [Ignavibacteria bacterium]
MSQENTALTFAPFASDTDLHIPAGLASPLESGGVSQVTTGVTPTMISRLLM